MDPHTRSGSMPARRRRYHDARPLVARASRLRNQHRPRFLENLDYCRRLNREQGYPFPHRLTSGLGAPCYLEPDGRTCGPPVGIPWPTGAGPLRVLRCGFAAGRRTTSITVIPRRSRDGRRTTTRGIDPLPSNTDNRSLGCCDRGDRRRRSMSEPIASTRQTRRMCDTADR